MNIEFAGLVVPKCGGIKLYDFIRAAKLQWQAEPSPFVSP